jgi:hypothetical protein
MKKIILFFLFLLGFSTVSYSQQPMIGIDESTIIKLNRDQFGYDHDFDKDYTREYWVLYTDYLGILCLYYFNYGNNKNILFAQISDDVDYVKSLYAEIKKNHVSLSETLFYEKRTELYIKFKKDNDGIFTVIWSRDLIKD